MRPKNRLCGSLLSVIFSVFVFQSNAQLVVDNSVTATNAIQNILLGGGVTVMNITFSGAPEQIGSFDCVNCNLGISDGFVIGSGNVSGAAGPNTSGTFSSGPASGVGASDPDLFQLSNNPLNDAAILEFDFIPTGDSVAFNFVFGSDEYPEFAGSTFNDAFGFFLSGPGITGPYSNNAANIAIVPNTSTPITINNINNGSANTGPCNFCQYYINNLNSFNAGANTIQCDGFTTVMTASAEVICGETYHIKMAVADAGAGDTSYDSFVFFQANSFQSNQVAVTFEAPAFVSPAVNGLYEGCQTGFLTFSRPEGLNTTVTYDLMVGGTADASDVLDLPMTITFVPQQSQFVLPITAVTDGVFEGVEILELSIDAGGCEDQITTFEIQINDLPELEVDVPAYQVDCGGDVEIVPAINGGIGFYHIEWSDGSIADSFNYTANSTSQVPFIVTDTCGVTPFEGFADVTVNVGDPIQVDLGMDQAVTCLDVTEIIPSIQGGFGTLNYEWSTQPDGVIGTGQSLQFQTDSDIAVALVITDQCGASGDDIVQFAVPQVNVNIDVPNTVDTPCLDNLELLANANGGVGTLSYQWELNNTVVANGDSYSAIYGEPTSVTLIANDECGNSAATEIEVNILPSPITVNLGPDLSVTCLDETLLNPEIIGGVGTFTYQWTLDGLNVGTLPTETVTVYDFSQVVLNVEDQCGNTGSDQLNLNVPPVPVYIEISNDTLVCNGASVELYASVSGGVGQYITQWYGSSNSALTFEVAPATSTTYTFGATDQCGNSSTANVNVAVDEIDPIIRANYTGPSSMHFENITANAVWSYWIINGQDAVEGFEADVEFNTMDVWEVMLVVESPLGCPGEAIGIYYPLANVYVPNAFTPNNDGTNDFWSIDGHDLSWLSVQIFNRWGDLVFESEEITPVWDGGAKEGEYFVPDGIYFYQLKAQGTRGNIIEKSGTITVIR
ncbi:MAG: choice-of-anchor L domain-containing protein [Flavobacteriales bacterium]